MALITCKDLEFQYEGKTVLSNVSFELENGDYLCIVGPNGSGKTTLIKGILGIINPKKGKIIFDEKKQNIGYLPQQTDIKSNFPASVYEVVLSGCINKIGFFPFYTKKEKETALKNMKLLEIFNIKNKSFNSLSGGQQQRVLLARALCATSNILLLDEPNSGLDPTVTNSLYKIVKKLNKENNITIIMISHDINHAINDATHILHLDSKQLFFGTLENYRKNEISRTLHGGENNDK